ncbi:MAG: hypothetical protein U0930_09555 [Pirellulales bacterium]
MRHLTQTWFMVVAVLLLPFSSCSTVESDSIVGTWKGIDEYGHEHFFTFSSDGELTWWDMDRSLDDGSFSKRGPFKGSYKRQSDGKIALSDGFQSIGILTGGEKELRQDDTGHAMRRRLMYKKISDTPTQAQDSLGPDEQQLVVIGQVIGTQNERVSNILKQAGIDCMLQGDEFHEILVPKHSKQRAVELIAKDAQEVGYEVSWVTP